MNKKLSEEEKINIFFVKCFNNILREEERKLKLFSHNNLSVSEFHIIEAIASSKDNNSSKNIAKKIGITAGSLTVAASTLEKKGYIFKQKDDVDKRIIRLFLTDKGMEVNLKHEKFHENMTKGIVKSLNKRELITLTNSLEKINKYIMENEDEI